MALPHNMTQNISRSLLEDVLCRMLTHITSLTADLDVAKLVATDVAKYDMFNFAPNNDFGMLVEHLGGVAHNANTQAASFATIYDSLHGDDAYVDSTVQELSFALAGSIITAHAILRDIVPDEVDDLTAKIDALLTTRLGGMTLPLPEVEMQSWGQLGDESYRLRVIHMCQDLAHIFNDDRPIRSYYAASALAAADRLVVEDLPVALRAEGEQHLSAILGETVDVSDMRFCTSVLFRGYGITNLVSAARVSLESGDKLDSMLGQFTKIETAIAGLSAKSGSSDVTPALADWLAARLPVMEKACLLIAGAFYALLATTYHDTLVLTTSSDRVCVNAFRLASFEQAGGSVEALAAFGHYLQSRRMQTPHMGWSEAQVLKLRESAMAEVLQARADLERRTQADNSVVLRSVVERIVTTWTSECTGLTDRTPDGIVKSSLQALLTRCTDESYSMSDLLTNYLVEIRNNTLLSTLKTAIYKEFARLADKTELSPDERNTCVAKAMLSVMASMLISKYATKLAA